MRAKLVSVLVLAVLLANLLAPTPLTANGSRPGTNGSISLDPTLPIHPYLQYAAQAEPKRWVRLLIQKTGPQISSEAIARVASTRVLEEFPFIHSLVLEVPARTVFALARQPGVRYISYDAPVRHESIDTANLKTSHQAAIGLPALWNGAAPATGKGVTVAVLDSGVNFNHPDLAANLISVAVNGKATNAKDGHGHGTHVVGIINGRDPYGRYIGAAPEATVVSVKIADDLGMSKESDMIRGLQWVFNNRSTYGIRVINLSISGSVPTAYYASPINAAVEQLWFGGVVVVVASSNRGSAPDAVWYPPANDPFVITVGALDDNGTAARADDSLAYYSARGITQDGFAKPEIIAPGRKIVAPLASSKATVALLFPERITDTNYIRLSGTSMAAPALAGVVAMVLQRFPGLTPDEVKWLLMQTAQAYPNQVGAGLVDPAAALQRAAAGSLSRANQGTTPANGVDSLTGTVNWQQAYWEQAYWEQAYWEQATYEMLADD